MTDDLRRVTVCAVCHSEQECYFDGYHLEYRCVDDNACLKRWLAEQRQYRALMRLEDAQWNAMNREDV